MQGYGFNLVHFRLLADIGLEIFFQKCKYYDEIYAYCIESVKTEKLLL